MEYDANTVFLQLPLILHKDSAASVTDYNLHTWKCTQQTVHSCLGMYVCIYKLVVPWPVHLIMYSIAMGDNQ